MKKAIGIVFVIVLSLYLSVTVFAAEPLKLYLEGYSVKDNVINVYCSTNLSKMPAANEMSLSIGNTVLPLGEIKVFSGAEQGVSMVFIADVSGSIGAAKLQSIKDTLNSTVDWMSPLDNASVLTVGNEANIQSFVSDKAQLKKQIGAIKGKNEDTNLYSSIVKALDFLSTSSGTNAKKCIVILSDGEDHSIKGITREEVNAKIEKLHIPIYTVAMLGTKPAEKYVQTSKILGSFARLSPGGIDYIHQLNKESSSKIAAGIKSSIDKSLILSADLSGLKSGGSEMYMKVELAVGAQGKANAGYSIPTSGFTQPEPEKEPASGMLLYIGIPLVILILIIIILILKRRKKSPSANITEPEPPVKTGEEKSDGEAAPELEPVPAAEEIVEDTAPDISIRLTKVGPLDEEVYQSEINDELVIGRDSSKAALSFPKDDLLSSRHCKIAYLSGQLFLQDLGSTNGTYVNGVKISGMHRLDKDDIILIGSMELRIMW